MKREALAIDIFVLDYDDTWFNRKIFSSILSPSLDVRSSGYIDICATLSRSVTLQNPGKTAGRVGDDNLSR